MIDTDMVGNFSTFTAEFSATSILAEPMLMSDIYEVVVDFIWVSDDLARGNSAFLKMKFFIEETLNHSIITHPSAPIQIDGSENNIVLSPMIPTPDVLSMLLHAKLSALGGDDVQILSVKTSTTIETPGLTHTYLDTQYKLLPDIKEFLGVDKYYYDEPWWHRDSPETVDYDTTDDPDLTNCPQYDNIFGEIDSLVLGELNIKPSGGEVIDIENWKPTIVKKDD